jgi:putative ABC transport system permease protein
MVQVSLEDARNTVTVQPKYSLGAPGSGTISLDSQNRIKEMPEVDKVIPWVVTALGGRDDSEDQAGFSGLAGFPPEETAQRFKNIELESGSYLEGGDTVAILVGHAVAQKYDLHVGDIVNFRNVNFYVKGIFKPYEGLFANGSVVAPLETVRRIALLPPQAVVLNIIPKENTDTEVLANRINEELSDVKALSPKKSEEQANRNLLIFRAMVLGLAVISLVVGGVATTNTMVMAISERTREIGLKKALGAPDWAILFEYVTEATVIGFIAGVFGLVVGIIATIGLNKLTSSQFGLEIFRITIRLGLFAVVFSVCLGAIAGFFPALRAALLNPVKALRTQ